MCCETEQRMLEAISSNPGIGRLHARGAPGLVTSGWNRQDERMTSESERTECAKHRGPEQARDIWLTSFSVDTRAWQADCSNGVTQGLSALVGFISPWLGLLCYHYNTSTHFCPPKYSPLGKSIVESAGFKQERRALEPVLWVITWKAGREETGGSMVAFFKVPTGHRIL